MPEQPEPPEQPNRMRQHDLCSMHQAILDDLQEMNDNTDEDKGNTICSEVVEDMIENDKSE